MVDVSIQYTTVIIYVVVMFNNESYDHIRATVHRFTILFPDSQMYLARSTLKLPYSLGRSHQYQNVFLESEEGKKNNIIMNGNNNLYFS